MDSSCQDSAGTEIPLLPLCFPGEMREETRRRKWSETNERIASVSGVRTVWGMTALRASEPGLQGGVSSPALGSAPSSKSPSLVQSPPREPRQVVLFLPFPMERRDRVSAQWPPARSCVHPERQISSCSSPLQYLSHLQMLIFHGAPQGGRGPLVCQMSLDSFDVLKVRGLLPGAQRGGHGL